MSLSTLSGVIKSKQITPLKDFNKKMETPLLELEISIKTLKKQLPQTLKLFPNPSIYSYIRNVDTLGSYESSHSMKSFYSRVGDKFFQISLQEPVITHHLLKEIKTIEENQKQAINNEIVPKENQPQGIIKV